MWRYPILIGPAAYYLGEFRPKNVGYARWFARLMKDRPALDATSFVAWHGMLAGYYLVVGGFVAAVLQSSPMFMVVIGLFVAILPISAAAFCLLSVVVLVHAGGAGSRWRQLKAVPRAGPLWVRGFRQYYERVIRPTL